MRYYIIAGEASGDLHAANLVKELKQLDPGAAFRGWGGDLMQEQGVELVRHYREMAYMGLVEVLAGLPAILRNIRLCKQDLLKERPDVLILVDFPGFNMRIAAFAKKHGVPVFYYISPKIWAWNQKRVLQIRRYVDRMFCILPFEVDFYRQWGMEVDYVGNPLMDAIGSWQASRTGDQDPRAEGQVLGRENLPLAEGQAAREGQTPGRDGEEAPSAAGSPGLIALLPGSRRQEITRILPEMLKATDGFPGFRRIIAGAPSFSQDFYHELLDGREIEVRFGHTYDLLHKASAALVASGTATLEAALLNVPQAVLYKASPLTVAIARRVLKIKYISLVNLISGKEVVRELIQEDCSEGPIRAELDRLLHDLPYRGRIFSDYRDLQQRVGGPGASRRAAEKMLGYLSK